MGKKGQGHTFWIIIAAVIALAVLVVLLMIFIGKVGPIGGGLMDCKSKGGFCVVCDEGVGDCSKVCADRCLGEGYEDCSYSGVFSCPREGEVCCLGIKEEKKETYI